ncbi:hypothetical protein [Pseudodesulfovibrio sediminis]|uniref:Uncharacterized protein n=1 Tax=Pseudodesulfovibrio sediminis TaxID=2810563 RepID=A0ABM7P3F8_9BACT|nr:hypothetical protein [Pseudodesulfovibrio sediminis]BCS87367.1 hypothetical protein PSDVSF_06090 [Pseudodesulfovibrio sediminis]
MKLAAIVLAMALTLGPCLSAVQAMESNTHAYLAALTLLKVMPPVERQAAGTELVEAWCSGDKKGFYEAWVKVMRAYDNHILQIRTNKASPDNAR